MKNKLLKFSLERFILLIVRDLTYMRKSILILSGAMAGVFISLNIVSEVMDSLFGFFYFTGGFIFTSGIFRELHARETVTDYLMLPASSLEKFAERLFIATAGWTLYSLVLFSASSFIIELIKIFLEKGSGFNPFNPMDVQLLKTIPYYLVNSSVFLLGAVYFKKMNFIKTILALFSVFIFLFIVFAAAAHYLWQDEVKVFFADNFIWDSNSFRARLFGRKIGDTATVFYNIIRFGYLYLLPPFCWITALVKLGEAEVEDAF